MSPNIEASEESGAPSPRSARKRSSSSERLLNMLEKRVRIEEEIVCPKELETVEPGDTVQCTKDNCIRSFASLAKMKLHIKRTHKNEVWHCMYEGCSLDYQYVWDAFAHIRTAHLGEPSPTCEFCHKSFSKKSNLTNHQKKSKSCKSLAASKYETIVKNGRTITVLKEPYASELHKATRLKASKTQGLIDSPHKIKWINPKKVRRVIKKKNSRKIRCGASEQIAECDLIETSDEGVHPTEKPAETGSNSKSSTRRPMNSTQPQTQCQAGELCSEPVYPTAAQVSSHMNSLEVLAEVAMRLSPTITSTFSNETETASTSHYIPSLSPFQSSPLVAFAESNMQNESPAPKVKGISASYTRPWMGAASMRNEFESAGLSRNPLAHHNNSAAQPILLKPNLYLPGSFNQPKIHLANVDRQMPTTMVQMVPPFLGNSPFPRPQMSLGGLLPIQSVPARSVTGNIHINQQPSVSFSGQNVQGMSAIGVQSENIPNTIQQMKIDSLRWLTMEHPYAVLPDVNNRGMRY